MKRRNTLLPLALTTIAMTACTAAPIEPQAATTALATAPPTTTAKAMGPAPTYKFPANLCAVIELSPFIEVQPGTLKTEERRRTTDTRSASSTCLATLGTLPAGLIVMTGLEIFTHERTGVTQFDGFKGIVLRDHPDAKNMTGVGDAAYFYTEPSLGPTLVVRHGTALIDVSVVKLGPNATIPADAQQRLTRLVHQILTSLPRA